MTMNRTTMAIALMIGGYASIPSDAEAQKYYARQTLVPGVAETAPAQWTYGPETTACVNDKSVGTSMATCPSGQCEGSKPADKVRTIGSCVVTCDPLLQGWTGSNNSGYSRYADTPEIARAECLKIAVAIRTSNVCTWSIRTNTVQGYASYNVDASKLIKTTDTKQWASMCTVK